MAVECESLSKQLKSHDQDVHHVRKLKKKNKKNNKKKKTKKNDFNSSSDQNTDDFET